VRTVGVLAVNRARVNEFSIAVFMIGMFAAGLSLFLGLFLRVASTPLDRGEVRAGKVMAACILAIIGGALALLAGLSSLASAVSVIATLLHGGWTSDSWAIPLVFGVVFLGVGTCSLIAAIKGLMVRGADDDFSRESPGDRRSRNEDDLDR
jgi:hypothetical protein